MSVRLWTKWLWVQVQLQSLKLHISRLLRARSSLTFRGNYRVWTHSETRTRYDKNIQTKYVAVRIPSQKGRFYYKSKILFALFIYQRKFSFSDFVHYILEDIFDLITVHRPTTIDCTQRTNLLTALNYYLRKYTD